MMRVVLFALCLFLSSSSYGQGKKYVLSIGVSTYINGELDLMQPAKDARLFAQAMRSQTPNIVVLTSKYANKDNVLEKYRQICELAQREDQVFLYFSGHGAEGHLLMYDSLMAFEELMNVAATSKAKDKVFFLDACHSGSVQIQGDNIFLVSSRPDEVSRENNLIGAGFFTRALVKGIRGASDTNKDRKITIRELYEYVNPDVRRMSKDRQHPQLKAPKEFLDHIVAEWNEEKVVDSLMIE